MSTIETNTNQEFDPDSLLGSFPDEVVETVPEKFNFKLFYSTFEVRPTSDKFEVKHELESNAIFVKCKNINLKDWSGSSKFKIKLELSETKATEFLLKQSQGLKITSFHFENLKVHFSNIGLSLDNISYTETDRTNRTGTVLIKF